MPSPEERRRSCWLRCSGEMKRAARGSSTLDNPAPCHLPPSSPHSDSQLLTLSSFSTKCEMSTSHQTRSGDKAQSEEIPRAAALTLAPPRRREMTLFCGCSGWAGLGWAGRCVQSECGTKSVAITMSQLQPSPASCPRPRAARSTTGILTQPAQPSSPAQPSPASVKY